MTITLLSFSINIVSCRFSLDFIYFITLLTIEINHCRVRFHFIEYV